jgi:hypothetical protein
VVVALNKVDALADKRALLPRLQELAGCASSRDRADLRGARHAARELKAEIAQRLAAVAPLYPRTSSPTATSASSPRARAREDLPPARR